MAATRRRSLLVVVATIAAIAVVAAAAFVLRPPGTVVPILPSEAPGTPRPEPPGAHVIIAAGDMADCSTNYDEATARVVDRFAGTVLVLGDNAYENGSIQDYRDCYEPTWGRFFDRTYPVPGNHDYQTPGAAGYFQYFGPRAGSPGRGWYAFDLGTWRIYALDADCSAIGGCDQGSPELGWLRSDLSTHGAHCVLAFWHHPRWSSGHHGSQPQVQPLWSALATAGTDVVLNGHDHMYERFARLDANGGLSPTGVREFVVGTGGKDLYKFNAPITGSEVRGQDVFGVIVLTLRDGAYDWQFERAYGAEFTDSGSGTCG